MIYVRREYAVNAHILLCVLFVKFKTKWCETNHTHRESSMCYCIIYVLRNKDFFSFFFVFVFVFILSTLVFANVFKASTHAHITFIICISNHSKILTSMYRSVQVNKTKQKNIKNKNKKKTLKKWLKTYDLNFRT